MNRPDQPDGTIPPGEPSRPARRPSRGPVHAIAVILISMVAITAASLPDLRPKNFGTVDAGKVYRSGQLTPAAFEKVVKEHGIRTVIDFGSFEPHERGDKRNQQIADGLGLTRYLFDLEGDATGNPNSYVQALRIMTDPAQQPVLVHCGAGAERTGAAAMLYKNMVKGVPLDEGLDEAQDYGHRDHRNPHLRQVIQQWAEPIIEAVRSGTQLEGVPPLPPPTPVAPVSKRG